MGDRFPGFPIFHAPGKVEIPEVSPLPEKFLKVIRDTIEKYGFDESHGIEHFLTTRQNAIFILRSPEFYGKELLPGIYNRDAETIIGDAAAFHDLIDSKYVSEKEGIENLRQELVVGLDYPVAWFEIILGIITSISFHTRKERMSRGLPMFPQDSLTLARQIVCDADQIDAYYPQRCLLFQTNKMKGRKFTNLSEEERRKIIWGVSKSVLVDRVYLYLDLYISTQRGKEIAKPLHDALVKYVQEHFSWVEKIQYC